MRKIVAIVSFFWAQAAWAHHDMTPLREAVLDGHSHDVGGATYWLVAAVLAMVAALYAVHWTIFRKS